MFLINSARPTSGKNVAKWLRLTNSFERVTHGVFEKTIEALEHRLIAPLPMAVVLPAKGGEDQTH
jgi:hypothetical protein